MSNTRQGETCGLVSEVWKLVSYRARGKERFGVVSPDGVGIIDVSARIEGADDVA